jgi:hypothetical protein
MFKENESRILVFRIPISTVPSNLRFSPSPRISEMRTDIRLRKNDSESQRDLSCNNNAGWSRAAGAFKSS